MSSLLVAPMMPALSGNGLAMRLSMFLEALTRLGRTDLLVLPVASRSDDAASLPERLNVATRVISTSELWDTEFALISRLADPKERLARFRRYGRPSVASWASSSALGQIKQFVNARRYKLVHVGRSYLSAASLVVAPEVSMTVDLDEDEVASHRQLAVELRDKECDDEAAWMEAEAEGFARIQESMPGPFSRIFVSSETDRQRIALRNPRLVLDVIENGVGAYLPRVHDDGRTIVFVGSFGYAPNVSGCVWFTSQVWPKIRAASPWPIRLRLVGRDMPTTIRELNRHEGIEVVGAVDNVAEAYEDATVAIAPLNAGAGTRIKVLEAAAFNVPIVATSVAVGGLRLTAPDAIWIADDPDDFGSAVLSALANPKERKRRSRRAREIVHANYNRDRIVDELTSKFENMLANEC
jgi:polysaccharide biosynthesis protein PslH